MSATKPSASLIIAAHLAALPARYAIGRWNNIPLSNIVIFNGIDLCTNITIKGVLYYFKLGHKKHPLQKWCLNLSARVITCITAYYGAAYLRNPVAGKVAALSNLAALATFIAICTFDAYRPR